MFGFPGWIEVTIILGIILLLFGKRLPGAMNSLGKSIVEFKKGAREDTDEEETSKFPPHDTKPDN
ncbi:MAG: twin-arginine translocase TatA/TatE family subunit [Planctomycetes bacterium]|nr:twin-arginine translocase TatA/TatE family subunit [Planctomycetota bacterium]MCH9723568.1 twin-arginine translocase TatA/TatE family subunit [Planctomycetota bacterium]MCH9775133.1 twin-arginine translocase TatA/TatE family subunit [Planctomycetota bacterium]MCH9790701.1 twin-arginine translocase TatA/TatE family subunit [Planctomycetota bacterium]MDF1746602.1 twin-arginine translocase TatA/TatE family subunit [Gimesia sp.]